MRHTTWISILALICLLARAESASAQYLFTFSMDDQTVEYDPADGLGSFAVTVEVTEDPGNPGYPKEAAGFAVGVTNDPALLIPVDAVAAGDSADIFGGAGPDVFLIDLAATNDAVFVTVLFTLDISFMLALDGPILELSYELNSETLFDDLDGAETPLDFLPADLFTLSNVVIFGLLPGGISALDAAPAELDGATITITPLGGGGGDDGGGEPTQPAFLRGDASGDGVLSPLLDALFLLNWQFGGGPAPPCLDAADIDGNNVVQAILDALSLLAYQFDGGPPPPAPGTAVCGVDPDAATDAVDCGAVADICQ